MDPFLIGIAGPSCSGKSEVARRVARILRAPILALDHYYRDLSELSFEERARTNFDAPDALDCELIETHVATLKSGSAIEQPTYDFSRHSRRVETEPLPSGEFVVIEGLFALYWPKVRALLNEQIFITAGHDVCLARRIYRDVRERGRSEESVREQYFQTVQPMCEQYIVPSQRFADVIISGVAPIKQSAHTILAHVAERVKGHKHLSLYLESPDSF